MIMAIDNENRMATSAPGEAFFLLVGQQDPQVVFQVRERSAVIKYFGDTGVEVRSGLFLPGPVSVAVVAVVFRVGQYVKNEYATWWNYHQEGCAEIFREMTAQDFLSFHFYGDNGRRDRTFIAINPLKDFFAKAIDTVLKMPSWEENDFISARMKLCSRYPTASGLMGRHAAGEQRGMIVQKCRALCRERLGKCAINDFRPSWHVLIF